jgi:hypothetical protein
VAGWLKIAVVHPSIRLSHLFPALLSPEELSPPTSLSTTQQPRTFKPTAIHYYSQSYSYLQLIAAPPAIIKPQLPNTMAGQTSMGSSLAFYAGIALFFYLIRGANAFGAGNIASTSKIEGSNWRHG